MRGNGGSEGRVAIVVGIALAGCIFARRSLEPPPNDEATVALLSGTLHHPVDDIARHPWFAVRMKGETAWRIFEVGGTGEQELDPFRARVLYGDPILHGMWRGTEAERAAACIERVAPEVAATIDGGYVFYPGPNSNTFGDAVLRRCKLAASLPATSVGKDWRGIVGAGVTSERTGVQVETPVLGIKVGLKEGVELHLVGLSFGLDLWPPALIVPLGPGRIGFADR